MEETSPESLDGEKSLNPGSALMDVDMDFSHPNLGALGIDNDALDINDLMDENILKSILPDSPPDSGSEHCHLSPHNEQFQLSPNNPDQHCQLSPHYSLSPPDLTTTGDVSITLYNDPVLYQDGPDTNIRNSGFYGRDRATYIPDISNVDYDQPLQIVESAQVISSMYPTGDNLIVEQTPAVRNQIMRHHAAPTVI